MGKGKVTLHGPEPLTFEKLWPVGDGLMVPDITRGISYLISHVHSAGLEAGLEGGCWGGRKACCCGSR